MGRPRKIQVIRSDDFSNPSELTVSELRALSISSANDIPNFLSCVPTVTQGSPWTDSSALPSGADLRYALPGLDFVLCNFAGDQAELSDLFSAMWSSTLKVTLLSSLPYLQYFGLQRFLLLLLPLKVGYATFVLFLISFVEGLFLSLGFFL